MKIKIGLSASDLTSRTHRSVSLSSSATLRVAVEGSDAHPATVTPGRTLVVGSVGGALSISGLSSPLAGRPARILIEAANKHSAICVASLLRSQGTARQAPCYLGTLEVTAVENQVRLVLICEPDAYLRGVLASEMPASYGLEALKAQAVTARTYALRPRVDHLPEGFNVCDSFLCCQNFAGNSESIASRYAAAIEGTSNQVLVFNDRPILALFSSCAGGHTESYENCFSDPLTDKFPAEPLPYLKGVPEGAAVPGSFDERALRDIWKAQKPDTYDSWSPHFRWKVSLSANALESHMHHVAGMLSQDAASAPFIKAPESGEFGHIDRFEISERGVAGTAMSMLVHTSRGTWTFSKELVIRSVFANPDIKLTRLKSARIFFEHQRDSRNLLSRLEIYGLGWGHGVGMQQTGAQGMATAGKNYRDILSHYFQAASITKI